MMKKLLKNRTAQLLKKVTIAPVKTGPLQSAVILSESTVPSRFLSQLPDVLISTDAAVIPSKQLGFTTTLF